MIAAQESMTAKLCSFARAYHSMLGKNKIFDDYLAYDIIGKDEYDDDTPAGWYDEGEDEGKPADKCKLGKALAVGATIDYLFDFGDCWAHTIEVKSIKDAEANVKYPRIVDVHGDVPPVRERPKASRSRLRSRKKPREQRLSQRLRPQRPRPSQPRRRMSGRRRMTRRSRNCSIHSVSSARRHR